MKNSSLLLLPALWLLTSCTGSNEPADAGGTFEATEIMVSAQGAGQLLWLQATEGATLQAGATVGLIDTTDLYLQKQLLWAQRAEVAAELPVLAAQAAVQQQQLTNLAKDFARIHNMLHDGAATQKQMDDIDGAMAIARRQETVIDSRRAALHSRQTTIDRQVAQLNNTIAKHCITNPRAGTVLVKYAEAGELAAPGKTLYKLADLSVMTLKVYIGERQLSAIRVGQEATALIDAPHGGIQTLPGTVSWVADKAEFTPKVIQTRDERVNLVFAVKITVPNDGRLKIGMPAEARFK